MITSDKTPKIVITDPPFNAQEMHTTNSKLKNNETSSVVSLEKSALEDKIIGRSQNFLEALNIAKRVAKSSANIFITGESGTGKEVIARFIHSESKQHKGPFVAINCSAIPESLLESELFGHAKGSFTGAQEKRVGLFEEAQDGTLFLDEIGDLNLPLQAKLLRVLQEKKIKRIGENQYRPINCRIISATHKSLKLEVQENRFREDLLFRLEVIPINIPPLRERTEDILLLAEFFLRKFSSENGSASTKTFSKEAISYLLENKWCGNVRELENTIERAMVLSEANEIRLQDFLPKSSEFILSTVSEKVNEDPNIFSINCAKYLPTLEEVVNKYLDFAVKKNDGARDRTAKAIGIDRKTLYKRIKLTEIRMPVNYSQ